MKVDLRTFELHNILRQRDGSLRVRRAMLFTKSPSGGTLFVGGFTVESPTTTEPWHYLLEQSTTTGIVTLRAFTEEFFEVWNLELGMMPSDPVFSVAVANNQMMINSPSLPAPLYGIPGGGMVQAVKTASINTGTTALDLPAGHIASFNDRTVIAAGAVAFFNDPPFRSNGFDPRTFVAENAVPLPGTIYDIFQATDGAFYIFTSAGVFALPVDATGQGQTISGFLERIPGIDVSRPRNAAATNGAVAVLQKQHVQIIGGPRIELATFKGRRYFSLPVEVDDLRLTAEIFGVRGGFVVAFRGKRAHFALIDLESKSVSWIYSGVPGTAAQATSVVGVLRSRDGEPLFICREGVLDLFTGGTAFDFNNGVTPFYGVACGRIDMTGQRPVVRRVVSGSGACGTAIGAAVSGAVVTSTTPALANEPILGTALWGASTPSPGRQTRTVRFNMAVHASDPHIELMFTGADREVRADAEVIIEGQGASRTDKNG